MPQVEPRTIGDFLLAEGAAKLSRKVFSVASGQNIKIGQVCRTNSSNEKIALAGTGNETHTYTPNAAPTAGTFVLHLWHKDGYFVATAEIAYDATNTAIATAINAVLGTSAVSVTGTMATTVAIVFSGTGYAALAQPFGWMDVSGLTGTASAPVTRSTSAGAAKNAVQRVVFGAAATAGNMVIEAQKSDGTWVRSGNIAWSATDATLLGNINTALNAVLGTSAVAATAIAATDTDLGFELTFSGTGYAGLAQPLIRVVTLFTSVTTVVVSTVTEGGPAGNALGNLADSIAIDNIDATSAAKDGVFLVRSAVVDRHKLYFGAADPDACIAALEKLDIVARSEPATKQVGP